MKQHLLAMCDGKRYCFLDHALACELRRHGLIWAVPGAGAYMITEAGRAACRE